MGPFQIIRILLKIREGLSHLPPQPMHETVSSPLYSSHIGEKRINVKEQRETVFQLRPLLLIIAMAPGLLQHQPACRTSILTPF